MNTSVQPNMNARPKHNNNFTKRKFFNENINNIEIEIIKRNYLNDLFNSYSKFHHFDFKPQEKEFCRNKRFNIDNSRIPRTDPQPVFSQNINYNVPTKKFLINNESDSVNLSNKSIRRKKFKNKKKNETKLNSINNDQILNIDGAIPSANLKEITLKDYEIDQANLIKTNIIQRPLTIDENLIKLDLHKSQSNKPSSSLYENFVKSVTKKDSKKEINSNRNRNNNVDNLELSLSNLSLSSNDTSSSSSKLNISKTNKQASNVFENTVPLKKSDSFSSKSLNSSIADNGILSQSYQNQNDQVRKKKRTKKNKIVQQPKEEKQNEFEFDFSNTNEFWEDEEHLVIGQDYEFDFNFNLDKE